MTEMSHFLAPEGWKVTFKDKNNKACSQLVPDPGTTLLIGRSQTAGKCALAWMDKSGVLRRIDNLVSRGDYWEAVVRNGTQYYVVTLWKNPKSRRGIVGHVEVGRKAKMGSTPGVDYGMQSSWGAEAGGGG